MEIRWKKSEGPRPEIREKEGVVWLSFPLLEQTGIVVQGFTTRLGGVSTGMFSSMNLSFTRGDREEAVRENFRRAGKAMGFSVESIVTSDQTHTDHVRVVTREDCGGGILRPRTYRQVDGLLTREPGVTLATFYADCVPLYFVDPVRRAIALTHSGWRGTVQRIGKVTVETMAREFGSRPEDLVAAIGPSICQDCYEVGEEVAEAFYREFGSGAGPEAAPRKAGGQISTEPVGSQPPDPYGSRRPSGEDPDALPLHLLQSGVFVFPSGLPGKTGKPGRFPDAETETVKTIHREPEGRKTGFSMDCLISDGSRGQRCSDSSLFSFAVVSRTLSTDTSWFRVSIMLARYFPMTAGSYQGLDRSSGVR